MLNINSAMAAQIVAAVSNGTLYVPKESNGIEVSHEAFLALYNKGAISVTVTECGPIVKQGRTIKLASGDNIGTDSDSYRVLTTLTCGEQTIKVRLHLCDLLPLLEGGNTGKLTFGGYFPGETDETVKNRLLPETKKYLIPVNPERYSASQIAEKIGNYENVAVNL
jgi:hypothetical protein